MDAEERASILREARTWLRTPYHHKARVKGVGVDCGGLLYEVFKTIREIKPFPEAYAADWSLHKNDELYLDFIAEYVLDVEEPEPGDIVVFKYARCFSHGGIWTERNTIIHAWGRTVHGGVQESKLIFFGARPRKFYAVR